MPRSQKKWKGAREPSTFHAPQLPEFTTPIHQMAPNVTASEMNERHQGKRPTLLEVLEAKLADKIDNSEEWKDAFRKYKEEATKPQTTSKAAGVPSVIPLPKPVEIEKPAAKKQSVPDGLPMIHETGLPPVNIAGLNHILHACKPDDPVAQSLIKENTRRLVEAGLVDKLGVPETPQSPDDETMLSSEDNAEPNTASEGGDSQAFEEYEEPEEFEEEAIDLSRVQAAHIRYWAAMGDYPDKVNK